MTTEAHLFDTAVHEFFDDIVRKDDGTLDEDAIYREFHDYFWLMKQSIRINHTITCGEIDSANASADHVLGVWARCESDKVADVLDIVLTRIEDGETTEELRQEFGL